MKFLKNENIIDDFFEECDFKRPRLANELEFDKKNITLWNFFSECSYSFKFVGSRKGFKFWDEKIFYNNNFREIRNKLLWKYILGRELKAAFCIKGLLITNQKDSLH